MSDLAAAAERLRKAGIERPQAEARLLLAHAIGVSQEQVLSGLVVAGAVARERFPALIERRAVREPFAYLTGTREFWSLPFRVGPGDRKSTRLNSSHVSESRMPSSA